jgi:hypothetical protein
MVCHRGQDGFGTLIDSGNDDDVMGSVHFSIRDAEILYAFPSVEADIATIVRHFMFINRSAAPTYAEIAGCLLRASRVGIIAEAPGGFVVDRYWYECIHKADELSENEIESMLRFQGEFVDVDFEEVTHPRPVLSDEEYRSIVASLH